MAAARESVGGGATQAIFRWFPEAADRLPCASPIGSYPTPVQPLDGLREGAGRAWIKRDDLANPEYGGNKVRKLDHILGEAARRRAGRLVTAGAAGSHHALATALHGRRAGFEVSTVLFPQRETPHVRRVLELIHGAGAEIRVVPRMELVPGGLVAARLAHRAARPFAIRPGGSDPVGTLGFVSAALELADQVQAGELPAPAKIFVAAGTLGTAVGLAIGLAFANLPTRVEAVRITSPLVTNRIALRRLVRGTLRLLRTAAIPAPDAADVLNRIRLDHSQVGAGYGIPSPAAERAASEFAACGITLEPTYTAKAAAAFLDACRSADEGPLLFWHTLSATEPDLPMPGAGLAPMDEALRRRLLRKV